MLFVQRRHGQTHTAMSTAKVKENFLYILQRSDELLKVVMKPYATKANRHERKLDFFLGKNLMKATVHVPLLWIVALSPPKHPRRQGSLPRLPSFLVFEGNLARLSLFVLFVKLTCKGH